MRLAVISDIHGNFDALVPVLKKAKLEDVDHLLILGDIVGYYYHPDKILEALSNWSFDIIKGNHEVIMDELIKNPSLNSSIRSKYGSGHQIAIEKLSPKQIDFLTNLPENKSVTYDNISILMSHGSPWSIDDYIYPDTDKSIVQRCNSISHDFVLIGHSHYAFALKNSNSILINPGSVGQSRQEGGKASWCLIDTQNSCFQFFSTEYNINRLLSEISEIDSDIKYLTEVIKRK